MIETMRMIDFDKSLNLRTHSRPQRAIKSVVFRVQGLLDRGWGNRSSPTQEAIINASWLYLADLSDEELARIFGEYLPRLEALMGGRGSDDSQGGTSRGGDEDGPGPARPVGHAELPPPKPPRRSPRKPKR